MTDGLNNIYSLLISARNGIYHHDHHDVVTQSSADVCVCVY